MKGVPTGDQHADRGDASLVGIVLLFGMVFVGASLVLMTGVGLFDDVQVDASDEQTVQDFQTLDKDLAAGSVGGDSISFDLNPGEFGSYEVNDSGRLSINVTNRFGKTCALEGGEMDLGTLTHENTRGEVVASQAGGIFRRSDTGTHVVSEPGIRYYIDDRNEIEIHRLEVDVTTFNGSVGPGQHDATLSPQAPDQTDCYESIGYPSNVTVEVSDSPYHDGWARFLREEFAPHGTVAHDPSAQRVVADAPLGHKRPFADFVDLEPTIYGGLYVNASDGARSQFDGPLTIDGYDSRNGSYGSDDATTDLLVVDTDHLDLLPGTAISGYPVVSGDLHARPGASVSPFVYRHGADLSPPAVSNGSVESHQVSKAFEPIEPVDGAIDDAHRYLQPQPSIIGNEDTAGEYYLNGNLAHSGVTFNVSSGDTHVAVDGDLSLTDVSVTGGGQVHIYVGGDEIDLDNVTVEADRADAIWIYGGNETDVRIDDQFQGVVYAPGHGALEIEDGTEIYGAVVGGRPGTGAGSNGVGDDVSIHFDTALRSAIPIPEEAQAVEREVRAPLDLSFVLDRSGSMDSQCSWSLWGGWSCNPGNDEDEQRIDATLGFIDELNETAGDRVGAYEFSTRGNELHELSNDFESVRNAIEANADGGTNISAGMKESLDGYDTGPGSDERVMVLLSDGENNEQRDNDRTREQARRAANMGVTVYTVGLGNDINDELLEDVANITGGKYVHVDEAENLERIFKDLAVDAIEAASTEFETITYDDVGAADDYVIKVRESTVDVGE